MDKESRKKILEVEEVAMTFGGLMALINIQFNVKEGMVKAIIGPNGAGKSNLVSFFKMLNEMMGGRLKTLHPKLLGGILARRGAHEAEMAAHGLAPIDLVAVISRT
ncbi:hypothetical protein LCGC14_2047380 [marine sediment metagenome]|uniref:ABC transporter domain-containing protein n=1 Tax=marine sediment metagenome TaxID=412755 RepID=A0A0F9HLZ8_9ZZZZ